MRAARATVGLVLLGGGAFASVRLAPPSLAPVGAAFALAVVGGVLVASTMSRALAVVTALALLGGGAALALTLHEDLRGERPDVGADPLEARGDPRVKSAQGAWLLDADAERLRFRATAPSARVELRPDAKATVTIENQGDGPSPTDLATKRPLRLLVWGDCRGGVTVLDRLCDAIRARKPDFTVGLGDFVGMARTYQFEILRDKLAATGVPAHLVPGNHDLDPFGTLRPYARVLGPTSWSFVLGDVVFLAADTADGTLKPGEVEGFDRVLRAMPVPKRAVLFLHHPIWAPPEHEEKPLPADDPTTKRLRKILVRERATVFSSHWHGFDAAEHDGVLQVVTGGAGSRLEYDGTYHYVWVEIDEAGIRTEKVDLATQEEISATLDRWKTFRDEAFWAARRLPLRVLAPVAALAAGLGAALSAAGRGRRARPMTGDTSSRTPDSGS